MRKTLRSAAGGNRRHTGRWMVTGASAAALAATWWLSDRAPYPYAQRWLLDIPLPLLTPSRLDVLLDPRPGERILEIGPGTGLQALHVAPQLEPHGRLDVVDIQQAMLDHVARRACASNITNVTPTLADAHSLPFADGSFDAAYAVTALGEIPDPTRALRELCRVLSPNGRLVIGEFFDRHQIRPRALRDHAEAAELQLVRRLGPPFAYYALLRPSPVGTGIPEPTE